jgi:hypothetical protein
MCIRDYWLVDISPTDRSQFEFTSKMLDAECFTQKTFPLCNLILQLVSCIAISPFAECLTKMIIQFRKEEALPPPC